MSGLSKWTPTTDLLTLRRLGKTTEECGELVAMLGRSICQGLDGVDPKTGEVNIDALAKESADVIAQIKCNIAAFTLDADAINARVDHKIGLMSEWEALFQPVAATLSATGDGK
jgi:NTP pyrophosphatase (non-canonical NTP hydrolase)